MRKLIYILLLVINFSSLLIIGNKIISLYLGEKYRIMSIAWDKKLDNNEQKEKIASYKNELAKNKKRLILVFIALIIILLLIVLLKNKIVNGFPSVDVHVRD